MPSILVVAARMNQVPLARREKMRRPLQAMLALGARGREWKKGMRILAVFQKAERQSCDNGSGQIAMIRFLSRRKEIPGVA